MNKRQKTIQFDRQAETFDLRAGLTHEVRLDIAYAIEELVQPLPADIFLDIGAGTGGIGAYLTYISPGYIGMDISMPMLNIFRRQVIEYESRPKLIQANANNTWPVIDHSVRIIFSSRSLHLLSTKHVVNEFFRVAINKGAVLIIGRIEREQDSVKASMRRQMRQFLKQRGIPGISGERNREHVIAACCSQGAQRFDSRVVARWQVSHSPINSLESWKMKSGLAGAEVTSEIKNDVLAHLETWANETYGGLIKTIVSEEKYILEGVWLT